MSPYLNFFGSFGLRLAELRMGHSTLPVKRVDGKTHQVKIEDFGLSGRHHVLLEGVKFPPERRTAMAQSVGPMTAFLCMIRSDGQYRKKWEEAVKRSMAMIKCIDDVIEVTKSIRRTSDLSQLTTLLAEVLLVTTARQAQRMYFPIGLFVRELCRMTAGEQEKFLTKFNCSGSGGFLLYKLIMENPNNVRIQGHYTVENAAQVIFHCIFGTYKEDLSILEKITTTKTWQRREQLGAEFKKGEDVKRVETKVPKLLMYSKMASANQSGMLSGMYSQITSVPCFSGHRFKKFGDDFFEHINKRHIVQGSGKNLPQLISALSEIVEQVHDGVRDVKGLLPMGTTEWRFVDGLTMDLEGAKVPGRLMGEEILFMGKPKQN